MVKGISLLKLHDIFFRKFLLLFTSIFILLGVIVYFWIKNIYIEQIKIDLLHNIDIASLQIKSSNNYDKVVKDIKKSINLRVTLIDENGVVIAESDKDKSTMDNHKNRSEIISSKYQKYGSIIRYSNTLKKELLYVSKQYNINNKKIFIRMARDIELINQKFLYLSFEITLLFLIFIAIAFWVSLKISQDVQHETQEILEFLDKLSQQTKAIKIASAYSLEFEKITQLLTNVSQALAKKDKQKSKYTAKLKLSNRQKDDIISAISHEFKNPIAVISGYTQTLKEDKDINEDIRDKFLDKIALSAEKLTDMIDRLRLSIKLEEGKQPYKFIDCNINKMVKSIIEDIKLSYPNRDIKLNGEKLIVKADETMLNIAITNLIENALKYSQDDVEVKIDKNSISIVDSGIGLKPKEIEKITQKFYRVSNNGWNNSLGVGLSLVKNIIEFHKFTLGIQSVENEGSTFSIIFKHLTN